MENFTIFIENFDGIKAIIFSFFKISDKDKIDQTKNYIIIQSSMLMIKHVNIKKRCVLSQIFRQASQILTQV